MLLGFLRPVSDVLPPSTDNGRRKRRRERASKSPRVSSSQAQPLSPPSFGTVTEDSTPILGGGLHFAKGVKVGLTWIDEQVVRSTLISDIISTCIELQTHALLSMRVVDDEFVKISIVASLNLNTN
ncbi:hypothetical protein VNO80_13146 [Phaseolus coccineus]|uniref:Uncharacterized protein n=1 Tax=Phaseolus coccineus TaxID=3886 RepID=A0AAN9N0I5_PHACN